MPLYAADRKKSEVSSFPMLPSVALLTPFLKALKNRHPQVANPNERRRELIAVAVGVIFLGGLAGEFSF
jgi:hypothetical protein